MNPTLCNSYQFDDFDEGTAKLVFGDSKEEKQNKSAFTELERS